MIDVEYYIKDVSYV